jgi:hypothetical protein
MKKNAVLFLLAIAVVVLAFQLFKPENVTKLQVKHRRHDHNGKRVDTEECARTGQDNKTCVILMSYLEGMTQGGPDTAIEVHRNDTIKWVGDNGETIVVQPMPGIDCSDHTKPDKPSNGGNPSLIGPVSGSGNIQVAQVTDNSGNDLYCYKTNIDVTLNGKRSTIDPHLFDEGP